MNHEKIRFRLSMKKSYSFAYSFCGSKTMMTLNDSIFQSLQINLHEKQYES